MRKRDLVDGVVGPRTRETMDQLLCMKGMTNAEKVDFLMSRNRELRAENEKLRVELTDLSLKSCPSCGIKVENEKLRDENARLRSCLSDDADNARQIMGENKKLRELVGLLFYGMHHDAPPHEELLWSQRVNRLTDELGIEVD